MSFPIQVKATRIRSSQQLMLEGGLEWRYSVQESIQETEDDLIFQKYEKISTSTT